MKIVSLLPAATEIVFLLGRGDDLRGVTFECDFPLAARDLPQVSGTALTATEDSSPEAIDAQVTALLAAGESIYTLDTERIRSIDPDVILTQDLCQVCAVPSGAVDDALELLGCHAQVVSLDPHRLDEVIACVGSVGAAIGAVSEAHAAMAHLRRRLDDIREQVAGRPRPRVLVIEWADPPFNAGHWVPDMVDAAGGTPVLAEAGGRSRALTWDEIAATPADVVLFMPCGFDLDQAVTQAGPLLARPELAQIPRVYAVDANSYSSRPGPRLIDGVELIASILHPDAFDRRADTAESAPHTTSGRATQVR